MDHSGQPCSKLIIPSRTVSFLIFLDIVNIFANFAHFRLAYIFGVAEQTFLRQSECIIDILIENISKFICWPHPSEFDFLANKFNEIGRHFLIIAIDGLHCEIEVHGEDRIYWNYKGFHSIHLQACCLYDLHFCNIFAGVPGRAHDSGIFGMSPISKNLDDYIRKQGRNLIETYNVLADSAYPISKYMITPYKNFGAMTQVHKKFNQHLGSKCQVYLSF